jgi:hypothetical protein
MIRKVKVKLSQVIKRYALKIYRGLEVWLHLSSRLEIDGGEWSASHPCRFTRWEIARGTSWIGGRVDPRVGLDAVEKRNVLPLMVIVPGTSTPSLYRLRYPGF